MEKWLKHETLKAHEEKTVFTGFGMNPSWTWLLPSHTPNVSTLFRILPLRTADEERFHWTQNSPSEWNNLNGWDNQPPSIIFFLLTKWGGAYSNSIDSSVSLETRLLLSTMWLFASKGQLGYRREEKMTILRGLNLITTDHYLNKVLLLLIRQGKVWKLPFVSDIQISTTDILPIGLWAREPTCECW